MYINLKYLVFILLNIILFYVLIYIKDKFLVNDKKWKNYRLADIIKGYCYNVNEIKYLNNTEKKLPNSIGGQYIKSTKNIKDRNNNLDILNDIISKKIKEENITLPNKDEIILHLRLGDSIRGYKNNKFVYFGKYATRIEHIQEISPLIKNKKIIIVYGQHTKYNDEKIKKYNEIYLEKVRELLKKNNIIFEEYSSKNPDKDFIFMCKAKTFIKSGGGYSKLISKMVKKNNNKVIDPFNKK